MKKNPFDHPDIFDTYKPAPSGFRHAVLLNIIPDIFLTFSFWTLIFLLAAPFAIFFISPEISAEKDLVAYVLLTYSFFFLLYAVLAGYIISNFRNSRMQEIKDRFGYHEK